MKTYYEGLGIEENASPKEIKKVYRLLALKWHPDKEGGNEEEFKSLKQIYEFLIDPVKRAKYDANLKKHREKVAKKEKIKISELENKIIKEEIKIAKEEIRYVKIKYNEVNIQTNIAKEETRWL